MARRASCPDRYDLASPIERLPLGVPQLLVHGEADEVVPIDLARRYAGAPPRAAIRASSSSFPGVGHMTSTSTRTPGAWRAVTTWLAER